MKACSRTQRMLRSASVLLAALVVTVALNGGPAVAAAASPAVSPATGGGGVPVLAGFSTFDLAEVGYAQSEVLLSGTANAYAPTVPLGSDGKFSVASSATAAYTTRAMVVRPIDPRQFNGTVIVEWLNVSGSVDAGPDWTLAHNELIREGFAWVGVSAQLAGLNATKAADPVRYASITHPGDSFSYDIFSQAGQAIRDNPGTVLGGLTPTTVIAVGESQSASRLVTYIDAVHPLVHVYDGFLVHSRGARGAALSQAPLPSVLVPTPTPIRDDLDVPVLVFQTETDVFNSNLNVRQPDTDLYRLWEVAGTAHFDLYGLRFGLTDTGDGQGAIAVLAAMQNPTNQPIPSITCITPINTGPAHWVLDAAIYWLNRWVTTGAAPPIAPRLQTTGVSPVVFALDANGNVLGGIRTPAVDAPVATLSGLGQSGSQFCSLFGTTVPFTPTQLATLYKNHGQFVSSWGQATKSAQDAGFLVPEDAKELTSAAVHSDIGK
jgi:Alpha/beta hydrolase domain